MYLGNEIAVAAAETSKPAQSVTAASFYARALSAAEAADFVNAQAIEGVDEEIATLRLRLRTAIEERPEEVELMLKGIDRLVKLVATRYRLSKRSERDLAASMANVVRGFGDLWSEDGDA